MPETAVRATAIGEYRKVDRAFPIDRPQLDLGIAGTEPTLSRPRPGGAEPEYRPGRKIFFERSRADRSGRERTGAD